MPGNPMKFSVSTPAAITSPPLLGQHTRSVLTDILGYDESHVESLHAVRAIG
jgi:CoA:oxalate CoA-transferase